jgi:hypothetical protein
MSTPQARPAETEEDHRGGLLEDERIDPRVARFGQAITFLVLLAGIGYRQPILIYATAALLVLITGSRFRIDPYTVLWEQTLERVLRPPRRYERAAPHRFAQGLNTLLTTVATVTILTGDLLLGNALAGLAAIFAGLGTATGFCFGCVVYRRLSPFLPGR